MLSWLEGFIKHRGTQTNFNSAAPEPEDVIPGPVEQNSLASTLNTEVVSSIQHLSRDSSVVLPHSNKKDQPVMMKDHPVHPTVSSIKPQSLSQERGRRRRWEGTRY